MSAPTSSAPMTINANATRYGTAGYPGIAGSIVPSTGVNAIAPISPSTHATAAISSRTTPRKNAASVDRPMTSTTTQSNVVIGYRATRPSSNSHSLASRIHALHVDINSRFHQPVRCTRRPLWGHKAI